jgi:hypothetical protein
MDQYFLHLISWELHVVPFRKSSKVTTWLYELPRYRAVSPGIFTMTFGAICPELLLPFNRGSFSLLPLLSLSRHSH